MKFIDEFYNQINGTAMGTIFTPTYAALSMGYFEIKFIVPALLSMESFKLNISRKTGTVFWMTVIQF